MAFTLNPPIGSGFLTPVSFRVNRPIPLATTLYPASSLAVQYYPDQIFNSYWLKYFTGLTTTQPVLGTPVFTGWPASGSVRPTSGFLYPRKV
jgi:hypothetical protein